MRINTQRVRAIVIRHVLTWGRELESLTESFWWPSFDVFLWGFTTVYLERQQGISAVFIRVFLGAIFLWMFVYRAQGEVGMVLLREVWDRNLLNLFTSPLTPWEFNVASLLLGIMKLALSAIWMAILAQVLFSFNIFQFGWYLIPFVMNLVVTGWVAGFIINGLILRFGNRYQVFVWTLVLIIQPFSAVFYSVSSLPPWMQWATMVFPTSYIFEGMRAVLLWGFTDYRGLLMATGENIVYVVLAITFFARSFRKAQETGMLVKLS